MNSMITWIPEYLQWPGLILVTASIVLAVFFGNTKTRFWTITSVLTIVMCIVVYRYLSVLPEIRDLSGAYFDLVIESIPYLIMIGGLIGAAWYNAIGGANAEYTLTAYFLSPVCTVAGFAAGYGVSLFLLYVVPLVIGVVLAILFLAAALLILWSILKAWGGG